jgi:hypothetical protein
MVEIQFKKKDNWKAYLTIAIIVFGLAAVYFLYFFSYNCSDLTCFHSHQEQCAKTTFISDQEDTTWKYFISGEEDEKCKINVEIINIKKGSVGKQKLEGNDMDCFLPLGSLVSPESDISRCHGILKEEMQNLIIQQLHTYIVENVQDIGSELDNIV